MPRTVDPGGDVVAALLLPRAEVSNALRALNRLTPRWGMIISTRGIGDGGRRSSIRKGVHVPDPRDESPAALRAIELPPPLDIQVAKLASRVAGDAEAKAPQKQLVSCPALCCTPLSLLFGRGPLHSAALVASCHAETVRATPLLGCDCPLERLLAAGTAVFLPHFRVPLDVEDLHPCLAPEPGWAVAAAEALPAQEDESAAQLRGGAPCRGQVPFRFIELFAGVGGFRIALETIGGRCAFVSEMHPTARAVYCENWRRNPGVDSGKDANDAFVGDIRLVPTEDVPEHDILTAGFPCQPFSALGAQEGLQESRGRLFMHVVRILRGKRPAAALLENVPGLLETDEGRALETVLHELRSSGYRVAHRVYNSQNLLPQKRKRVYIVAIRADLTAACESFRFPWLPELHRSIAEAIECPLPVGEVESLVLSKDRWERLRESKAFHETQDDILARLDAPAAPLVSSYGQGGGCGQYARYTQLLPARGGSPVGLPRRFSRRECARLQGFPEAFTYVSCDGPRAWYRLIGNAVSPPVICALAGALLCSLQHGASSRCRMPGVSSAIRLALSSGPEGTADSLLMKVVAGPGGESMPLAKLLHSLDDHNVDP